MQTTTLARRLRNASPLAWPALLFATACAALASGHRPEIGEQAPEISLDSTAGTRFSLGEARGRQPVVLAFFPKAFTGGCTKEMSAWREAFDRLGAANAAIYGISTDDLPTQKRFAESLKLPFPLLADPEGVASRAFGVYTRGVGLAARTTFVIGDDGKVLRVIEGGDAIDPAPAIDACPRRRG